MGIVFRKPGSAPVKHRPRTNRPARRAAPFETAPHRAEDSGRESFGGALPNVAPPGNAET
jgi:hypothetical protein